MVFPCRSWARILLGASFFESGVWLYTLESDARGNRATTMTRTHAESNSQLIIRIFLRGNEKSALVA